MSIKVSNDWTFDSDYSQAYARTNDPRVLAVIERDENVSFQDQLDGDAIFPTYMIDRDKVSHIGGYDDDAELAQRIVEAQDRFRYAAGYRYDGMSTYHYAKAEEMLSRWAWVFYGTTVNRDNYGYGGSYDILVMNTPQFRKHVGAEEPTQEQAQLDVNTLTSEIEDIADGNVYGIGWATFEERVMEDDEEIDLTDWNINIECWGYIGETYAQESASNWEGGEPELHPMLDITGN